MPKYLNTTGVSYELENLIKKAKDKIILISPYLKLDERIFSLLEDADRLKLDIRVVYGKGELQPEQSEKIKQLRSVRLTFAKNLHAKCYLNENTAIVTSMNLYEFSMRNNFEMGILFDRVTDSDTFAEISEDVQRLIRMSDEVQISVVKVAPVAQPNPPARATARPAKDVRAANGFCIRCKTSLPLSPEKPYCREDYERWAEYKNDDYVDKFCHGCGKKHGATMRKPLCRDCWKAAAS